MDEVSETTRRGTPPFGEWPAPLGEWAREFWGLFPVPASTVAGDVDALYFFMVGLSSLVSFIIAALIVFFCIRYYKGRKVNRSNPPMGHIPMELAWAAIPLVASIVIFIWSAKVFVKIYTPPAGSQDIYVIGLQWMWKIQHPQGPREVNQLHVPVGRPIRLVLTSQDVIHSFYIPAFRIKKDAVPGRYTEVWFQATRPGRYHLFCTEYCGSRHSGMVGQVVAMEPQDFQAWLATGGLGTDGTGAVAGMTGLPGTAGRGIPTLAQRGGTLFQSLGCSACHAPGSPIQAPELAGVYGNPVPLADGGTVRADEAYLRESIYFPQAKIVAGYQPVMPSFQGVVSEEDMLALIAFIRSMGADPGGGTSQTGGATVPNRNAEVPDEGE